MNQGWIKLHRELLKWEWFQDANTLQLFLFLLLSVNHEERKWQGNTINPGEKITSYPHLAKDTGLSVQNIRTSLNKLKSTGELTVKTTTKFSLIKVNNWEKYQGTNTPTNRRLTGDQQTTNTKQECKNDKNEKKNTGRFAPPSLKEVSNYIQENNYSVDAGSWIDFYESKGWMVGKNKMKSWQAAVRTWHKRNDTGESREHEMIKDAKSMNVWAWEKKYMEKFGWTKDEAMKESLKLEKYFDN